MLESNGTGPNDSFIFASTVNSIVFVILVPTVNTNSSPVKPSLVSTVNVSRSDSASFDLTNLVIN